MDATRAYLLVWTPNGLRDSTPMIGKTDALSRAVASCSDCCLLEKKTIDSPIRGAHIGALRRASHRVRVALEKAPLLARP